METVLFYLFGALTLATAVMTVVSRNAVVAAVWLIASLVASAGLFALLSAPLLAILQVLVYAGAIMVLFLFVIMMLQGPELSPERRPRPLLRKLVLLLPPAAGVVIALGWVSRLGVLPLKAPDPEATGTVERVGALLLGRDLLAFELISVVLLVAIIGALALGRREEELPWR